MKLLHFTDDAMHKAGSPGAISNGKAGLLSDKIEKSLARELACQINGETVRPADLFHAGKAEYREV